MNQDPKITLIIAGYAILLWSANWRLESTYDRKAGVQFSAVDLRGFGAVIGCVVTLVCIRRLWVLLRQLLASGALVPTNITIFGGWKLLLFLLPLAIGFRSTVSELVGDGTLVKTTFTYGGTASGYSILFSACAILLFRATIKLETLTVTSAPTPCK